MSADQAVPILLAQVPKYWQFQSEVFAVSQGCQGVRKVLESLPVGYKTNVSGKSICWKRNG